MKQNTFDDKFSSNYNGNSEKKLSLNQSPEMKVRKEDED